MGDDAKQTTAKCRREDLVFHRSNISHLLGGPKIGMIYAAPGNSLSYMHLPFAWSLPDDKRINK
jgi:hypothetical protein